MRSLSMVKQYFGVNQDKGALSLKFIENSIGVSYRFLDLWVTGPHLDKTAVFTEWLVPSELESLLFCFVKVEVLIIKISRSVFLEACFFLWLVEYFCLFYLSFRRKAEIMLGHGLFSLLAERLMLHTNLITMTTYNVLFEVVTYFS